MLRFTIALLLAVAACETAVGADRTIARRGWHRTAVILPAGLPRPHYNFRTTIAYEAPYVYGRTYAPRAYVYETPEVLFTPGYTEIPYIGYWDRLPYACGVYGYC